MAFDAQQTGKARAVIVGVLVVVVIIIAVILAFQMPGTSGTANAGDAASSATSSQAATDASEEATQDSAGDAGSSASDTHTVDDIDAQYGTTVRSLKAQYEADPSNPSALYNLANAYFDWGLAVQNHAVSDDDAAHAVEVFKRAVSYYDTYLADNPDAKSVTVDRAICVFYTGDHTAAITDLEEMLAQDDSFAPAWANLGMFYENDGRTDDAQQAYERALATAGDDDPYNVKTYAEQRLEALEASS